MSSLYRKANRQCKHNHVLQRPFLHPYAQEKSCLINTMVRQEKMLSLGSLIYNPFNRPARDFAPMPSRRKQAEEPYDNGTFILPLKQSFVRNGRIMDSTARMLALLVGWAGKGTAIETTQGSIGKKVGKSVRQIQRMLLDAWREQYLTYSYTKSSDGMITGIRIYLKFSRLLKRKTPEIRRNPGTTSESSINRNPLLDKKNQHLKAQSLDKINEKLRMLARAGGFDYQFE